MSVHLAMVSLAERARHRWQGFKHSKEVLKHGVPEISQQGKANLKTFKKDRGPAR